MRLSDLPRIFENAHEERAIDDSTPEWKQEHDAKLRKFAEDIAPDVRVATHISLGKMFPGVTLEEVEVYQDELDAGGFLIAKFRGQVARVCLGERPLPSDQIAKPMGSVLAERLLQSMQEDGRVA